MITTVRSFQVKSKKVFSAQPSSRSSHQYEQRTAITMKSLADIMGSIRRLVSLALRASAHSHRSDVHRTAQERAEQVLPLQRLAVLLGFDLHSLLLSEIYPRRDHRLQPYARNHERGPAAHRYLRQRQLRHHGSEERGSDREVVGRGLITNGTNRYPCTVNRCLRLLALAEYTYRYSFALC